MRTPQLNLGISIERALTSIDERNDKRRYYMMKGRPRELEPGSKAIKVGITDTCLKRMDRSRMFMNATRPEAIRTAVQRFVKKYGNGAGVQPPAGKKIQKTTDPEHKTFIKVPFGPKEQADLQSLSHAMAKNVQCVINVAVREWLEV